MRKAFSSLCSLYFNPTALFLLEVCMASDQWIDGSRPLKLLWHLANKQRVIMARQGEHLKPYHINKNLYLSVEDECNWGAMVCIMWAANSYWVFRKYGGKKTFWKPCKVLCNWFCSDNCFRFFYSYLICDYAITCTSELWQRSYC